MELEAGGHMVIVTRDSAVSRGTWEVGRTTSKEQDGLVVGNEKRERLPPTLRPFVFGGMHLKTQESNRHPTIKGQAV